ncbi:MAG: sodium:calcium antiporter [Myxococcota bacterium]
MSSALAWSAAGFIAASVALLLLGGPFTRAADALAERTGIGRALVGGVLLGALTSLPGLMGTGTAALEGRPSFAVSHALGGISAQTAFIVVADLVYRKANLEYAAASLPNLFQSTVLLGLLGLVLMAMAAPRIAFAGVHLFTPVLAFLYLAGLRMTQGIQKAPMWSPRKFAGTPEESTTNTPSDLPVRVLLFKVVSMGLVCAGAGSLLAKTGLHMATVTRLSDSFVGAAFSGVASSIPELVTTIFAVRAGALTLAVANIIGGNTFDVLMVCCADLLTADPIYHLIDQATFFIAAETIFLTAVLTAGMLRRQRRGVGFEGVIILLTYTAGLCVLVHGV